MSEPLAWNQLPAAAAWLSERCGRTLDARAVIDAVIRRSEPTAGTIIKAPVPPDCRVARIAFVGHMPDTEQVQFEHQLLEQQHGPLGTGMLYVRNEHPRVHCLCVAELTDLLLHGAIDVSQVRAPNDSKGKTIGAWLMPFGTKRAVSLDACGINRADLVALGDELAAGTPPEPAAPEPKAAPEWQELAQQRAREIIKEHKVSDWYPPQSTIADTIAGEFRRDGIMGTDGKPLSGATIKRHALRGISSAQGKQLSTAPRRGK
ncbi:hypothetical protein [Ottowia sp.]|uniref:hypothetical protein n=1 Tax=Ottowia sp. TaxID=1898956 RepID=UPI0025D6F729|nr:hypothetical protein [Ottowia sp.]